MERISFEAYYARVDLRPLQMHMTAEFKNSFAECYHPATFLHQAFLTVFQIRKGHVPNKNSSILTEKDF